jgi:hypothetical protein
MGEGPDALAFGDEIGIEPDFERLAHGRLPVGAVGASLRARCARRGASC